MTQSTELLPIVQADRILYRTLLSLADDNRRRRESGEPIIDGLQLIAAHRIEHTTPEPTDPAGVSGVATEALDMAIDLIQEAKGAEGPNGGFVTNHLDAAEGWLEKVRPALRPSPVLEVAKEALELAGNRLSRCAVEAVGTNLQYEWSEWAADARAALQAINERAGQ